jgi:hypothetical protein
MCCGRVHSGEAANRQMAGGRQLHEGDELEDKLFVILSPSLWSLDFLFSAMETEFRDGLLPINVGSNVEVHVSYWVGCAPDWTCVAPETSLGIRKCI